VTVCLWLIKSETQKRFIGSEASLKTHIEVKGVTFEKSLVSNQHHKPNGVLFIQNILALWFKVIKNSITMEGASLNTDNKALDESAVTAHAYQS